jgi:hypothetical protein
MPRPPSRKVTVSNSPQTQSAAGLLRTLLVATLVCAALTFVSVLLASPASAHTGPHRDHRHNLFWDYVGHTDHPLCSGATVRETYWIPARNRYEYSGCHQHA